MMRVSRRAGLAGRRIRERRICGVPNDSVHASRLSPGASSLQSRLLHRPILFLEKFLHLSTKTTSMSSALLSCSKIRRYQSKRSPQVQRLAGCDSDPGSTAQQNHTWAPPAKAAVVDSPPRLKTSPQMRMGEIHPYSHFLFRDCHQKDPLKVKAKMMWSQHRCGEPGWGTKTHVESPPTRCHPAGVDEAAKILSSNPCRHHGPNQYYYHHYHSSTEANSTVGPDPLEIGGPGWCCYCSGSRKQVQMARKYPTWYENSTCRDSWTPRG